MRVLTRRALLEPLELRLLFSTYYVSATGSDTAAGTQAAPWATLQRAARWVEPGDTVIVMAGNYSGFQEKTSGTSTAPITFSAQANVLINVPNNATQDGINLEGASFIVIQGFDIVDIPRAGIRSVTNQGVKILDNTITHSGMWGILTGFSQNVDIEGNTVSGSVKQHGIYVGNSADNPIIAFNTIFNNNQAGIHVNSDASMGGDGIITGALIDSNVIYNNGAAGAAAINLDGVEKSIIQNNILYDNHATGIALYKIDGAAPASDNIVVNNTILMAEDARWAIKITNGGTGNFVGNNIILNAHHWRGGLSLSKDSLKGLVSDHNAGVDRYSDDDGDSVLTLKQWQAATGQDMHSVVANLSQLFANPKEHDFHLAQNSPAVSIGSKTHAPAKDQEKNPRPGDQALAPGALQKTKGRVAAGMLDHLNEKLMAAAKWVALPVIAGMMALVYAALKKKGMTRWLVPYAKQKRRRYLSRRDEKVELLLCVADHYEPQNGDPPRHIAMQRVNQWLTQYPARFKSFRDSDGRPPRHSFFYPLEQFDPEEMAGIAELCRAGYGEVEVHLHHDHDNSENLRSRLLQYKQLLSAKYQLLSRHRRTGELMYGFIHGNWALDNSRPDGRWCGVNNELDVLRETGCYADFTLPSAPSPTQTRKINSIYYARDNPARPRSHDWGIDVGAGPRPGDSLMLIQGPLVLNWNRRKWGLIPRIENSCIQGNQAPSMSRLDSWLRARVQVRARPDWFFVKLHTHGAPEANQRVLLGDAMSRFHAGLAQRAADNPNFRFHYVTAREMYNLARAAEDHFTGSVNDARDYELISNLPASNHSGMDLNSEMTPKKLEFSLRGQGNLI